VTEEPQSIETKIATAMATVVRAALQRPNAKIAALEDRVKLLEQLLVAERKP
jgi:hypothetical protein